MADKKRAPASASVYDESKDEVLAEFKARDGEEGVIISLRSYQGGEPRVKILRYFKGRDGWKPDLQKPIPRLRWSLVKWFLQSIDHMDKGYEVWSQRSGRKRNQPTKRERESPFGR